MEIVDEFKKLQLALEKISKHSWSEMLTHLFFMNKD